MEKLVNIGLVLMLVSVILIIIGGLSSNNGESKVAVGGFMGPIPFGFVNNRRMLIPLIGFLLMGIILWFLLRRIS